MSRNQRPGTAQHPERRVEERDATRTIEQRKERQERKARAKELAAQAEEKPPKKKRPKKKSLGVRFDFAANVLLGDGYSSKNAGWHLFHRKKAFTFSNISVAITGSGDDQVGIAIGIRRDKDEWLNTYSFELSHAVRKFEQMLDVGFLDFTLGNVSGFVEDCINEKYRPMGNGCRKNTDKGILFATKVKDPFGSSVVFGIASSEDILTKIFRDGEP